jgi:ATP-dependent Lhr-like helicase
VLLGGAPVLYLERGGRSLLALREPAPDWMHPAIVALAEWIRSGRGRRANVERFDGESVFGSAAEAVMLEAGFFSGLRGLELRGEAR